MASIFFILNNILKGATDIMVDEKIRTDYPSNSRKSRAERKEPKRQEKIIQGEVVMRKKNLFRRMTDTFLGEDIDNVSAYIFQDVLIPAAKNTLSDIVSGGIEMLLFGDRQGRSRSRRDGRSYVRYDQPSYRDDRRDDRPRVNSRRGYDDIILTNRGDAQDVLNHLVDQIADYDVATVANLYDMVGKHSTYVDGNYGWTNLRDARVRPVRGGYLIDLPRALPID